VSVVWADTDTFGRDGQEPKYSDGHMNFVAGAAYHVVVTVDQSTWQDNGASVGYGSYADLTTNPLIVAAVVCDGLNFGGTGTYEFDLTVAATPSGFGTYPFTLSNPVLPPGHPSAAIGKGSPAVEINLAADYYWTSDGAEQNHGVDNRNTLTWVITDDAPEPEPPPPGPPIIGVIDDDTFDEVAEITSTDIADMKVRIELQGTGSGQVVINRYSPLADEDNIKKGNWLSVVIPQIQDDAIALTQIEAITTTVVSFDEHGGENVNIAGRNQLSYMERAKEMPRTYVVPQGEDYDGIKQGPASTGSEVGQILNRTLAEFQHVDRGVVEFGRRLQPLIHLTHDFDYDDDSSGDPWDVTPMTAELSAGQVGQTGLTSCLNLIGTGGIDIVTWPNMLMQAFNAYGRDLTGADFGTDVVRFVKGVNIAEKLDRQFAAPVDPTDTIVQGNPGAYGYASHPLAGTVPDVEGFVRTYGDDPAALEAIGLSDMMRRIRQGESVQFRVATPRFGTEPDVMAGLYLPGPPDERPTTHTTSNGNYWIGDTVTLSTGTGFHDFEDVNARIMAITISINDANDLEVTVELKATSIVGRFPTTGTPGSGMFGVGSAASAGGTGGGSPPPPVGGGLADGAIHDHIIDTSDAHDASAISILDSGANYAATNVETALAEVMDAEQAHEADGTDAHDASAISIVDTGGFYTGTTVEAALQEAATMGGGGDIEVSDGTTSVDPTSLLSFDPAFFEVSDEGADEALVTFIGETGGGGGGGTAFVGAHVYNSAAINLNNGSDTFLTFDSERYDSDAFHNTGSNTGRLTIPAGMGGKYHIVFHLGITSNITSGYAFIKLNGTTIIAVQSAQVGVSGANEYVEVVTDYDLAAGDYVEAAVQITGASKQALASGNFTPEFMLHKIGSGGRGDAVGARAYQAGSAQSISNATLTAVTFDSERFDTDGYHSTSSNTSRFTVPAGMGGKYLLGGVVEFAANATGARSIALRLNGSTYIAFETIQAATAGGQETRLSVETVYDLLAGEYVEVYVSQVSGGSLNIGNTSAYGAEGWAIRLDSGYALNGVGCLVYRSSTESVNNTVLNFNAEKFDSDDFHDNSTNPSRITIPTGLGGRYLIHFGTLSSAAAAANEYLRVRKNGTTYITTNFPTNAAGYIGGMGVAELVPGDYIEVHFSGNRTLGHATEFEAQSVFGAIRLDTADNGVVPTSALVSGEALATADTTISTTPWTDVGGLSVTLDAGVYNFDWRVLYTVNSASRSVFARLLAGSTVIDESEDAEAISGFRFSMNGVARNVVLTTTTTVKLQMVAEVATTTALRDGGNSTLHHPTKLGWSKIASSEGATSGTTFPSSPSAGHRFFRTDRGIEYFYDGTRWLSTTKFAAMVPYDGTAAPTATTTLAYVPIASDADIYVEKLTALMFSSGLSGSAYWTVDLRSSTSNETEASVASVNNQSQTNSVWNRLEASANSVVDTNGTIVIFRVALIKTSTPNAIQTVASFTYRLVG
jgi:hypothetical protein